MQHAYIDEHSRIESFLHHLDPRIKIISFFAFIICVIFTQPNDYQTFTLYAILAIFLVFLSRVPLKFILKRSLVIIPFVLMVSLFIPFIKQGRVAGGYSLGAIKLTVTYDGLMIFWNILIKAYLSILCMILLMATTRFSELLKALERLKIPALITMILSFMYRYIFVVQDELMKMKQAKDARCVRCSRAVDIKTLSHMIGVLFIRAYERAESVYLTMCSRGFDGRTRTLTEFKLNAKDWFFSLIMALLLIGIRLQGR